MEIFWAQLSVVTKRFPLGHVQIHFVGTWTAGINEHLDRVAYTILRFFPLLIFYSLRPSQASSMCNTVTTYTVHPCGAAIFSGRSHVGLMRHCTFAA